MGGFEQKLVWITGASSGIGMAVARELAGRGASIILSGRREEALEETARQIGGDTLILPFDTTDFDGLPAVADRALEWRGSIDLLVNNAGISQRSLAIDTDFAVYRRIMDVDFFAPVRLTQLVLPAMVERRSGHIAIVSSVAGKVGVPLRTGYSAAKHACLGYFDALRAEVETAYSVDVSVIVPGSVQTDIAVNALNAGGEVRGVSDANIAAGMPADRAATLIADGLAAREREIVVAEGEEARAITMRTQHPAAFFDGVAAEGHRLAEARAAGGTDWRPEPTKVR